ncbi:MAG: discoidin domain-containing protein [Acidobacteria bacterium]|nr:discoidin domain-containing protein [Acidobacteriota bacterium]
MRISSTLPRRLGAAGLAGLALLAASYWATREPAPRIRVLWRDSVTAEQQAVLETRYFLRNGRDRLPEGSLAYDLLDTSRGNIRRLVEDPAVADTNDIDREAYVVEPDTDRGGEWTWIAYRVPGLREAWLRQALILLLAIAAVAGLGREWRLFLRNILGAARFTLWMEVAPSAHVSSRFTPVVKPLTMSTLFYTATTVLVTREVFADLSTTIASDRIDPLLNAAILLWNARNVPWTDAWYQFPIFHPTSDALTFSEHLLGLSVITTPLYWMTRDPIVAYNLTFVLTYILSGMAMFALVWRLTGHGIASFLAGLAFLIAPYRAEQIGHIQTLAAFWAPLALLGLHGFLQTGRTKWLALFGVCWLLQGAANGYYLVFFSVLVGFWGVWFVIAQRRWRDAVLIVSATLVAVLPLVPILLRYVEAHARYRLTRTVQNIVNASADVSSVACGVPRLSAWGWLDVGICGGERQLFPGVTLLALCIVSVLGAWAPRAFMPSRAQRMATTLSGILAVMGLVLIASAAVVAVTGPWRLSVGPISGSVSSVLQPFARGIVLLVLAIACAPAVWRAVRTASVPGFYLLMAPLMWAFTWGPFPALYGKPALDQGPYAWLMLLPGVNGLRVPARFWMMTVLCLCIAIGVLLARALPRRPSVVAWCAAAIGACGLLVDGWATIPAASLLPGAPRPELLRGGVVLTLPLGRENERDVAAEFDAVSGGWFSVNGHSGYDPPHYASLREASKRSEPDVLSPFLARGDLNVILYESWPAQDALIESLPGVELVGRAHGYRQYRVPRSGTAPASETLGARLKIASTAASCLPDGARRVVDGDSATRWRCGPQRRGQQLTADLGRVVTVGQVVPAVGAFWDDVPRGLLIETSVDGAKWDEAWKGGVAAEAFEALVTDARLGRIVLSFAPRQARYVRLQLTSEDAEKSWSVTELEIWSGPAGP